MYWHKQIYNIESSEEEFQAKWDELIEEEEKNTFNNHLLQNRFRKNETVRGERSDQSFVIWRRNARRNGFFYPIFKGRRYQINGQSVLEIKIRFNSVAMLFVIIITAFIGNFVLKYAIFQGIMEPKFIFRRAIFGIIILLLFQTVPLVGYYGLKNQTLRQLQKYFGLSKFK